MVHLDSHLIPHWLRFVVSLSRQLPVEQRLRLDLACPTKCLTGLIQLLFLEPCKPTTAIKNKLMWEGGRSLRRLRFKPQPFHYSRLGCGPKPALGARTARAQTHFRIPRLRRLTARACHAPAPAADSVRTLASPIRPSSSIFTLALPSPRVLHSRNIELTAASGDTRCHPPQPKRAYWNSGMME